MIPFKSGFCWRPGAGKDFWNPNWARRSWQRQRQCSDKSPSAESWIPSRQYTGYSTSSFYDVWWIQESLGDEGLWFSVFGGRTFSKPAASTLNYWFPASFFSEWHSIDCMAESTWTCCFQQVHCSYRSVSLCTCLTDKIGQIKLKNHLLNKPMFSSHVLTLPHFLQYFSNLDGSISWYQPHFVIWFDSKHLMMPLTAKWSHFKLLYAPMWPVKANKQVYAWNNRYSGPKQQQALEYSHYTSIVLCKLHD